MRWAKFIAITGLFFIGAMMTSCIGAGDISSVGQPREGYFPHMTGIDLQGKERVVPESLQGTWRLVTVAFEREQQKEVNTWIDALPELQKAWPELRYYELPVIYEMNAASRFWVNNGMRSGIENEQARERTVTIYTNRDKLTSLMNMDTSFIYTFLLNEDGMICWRYKGPATETAQKALLNYFSVITSEQE